FRDHPPRVCSQRALHRVKEPEALHQLVSQREDLPRARRQHYSRRLCRCLRSAARRDRGRLPRPRQHQDHRQSQLYPSTDYTEEESVKSVDTTGLPGLWRRYRGLPRNVFAIGLVSLLNDASSEIIYPLLPIFLAGSLGASARAIGTIEGLAE